MIQILVSLTAICLVLEAHSPICHAIPPFLQFFACIHLSSSQWFFIPVVTWREADWKVFNILPKHICCNLIPFFCFIFKGDSLSWSPSSPQALWIFHVYQEQFISIHFFPLHNKRNWVCLSLTNVIIIIIVIFIICL